MTGSEEQRVEALRKLLDYPLKERDSEGSRFWYLRPGNDKSEAEDICPIAVGFFKELNQGGKREVEQWLTEDDQDKQIRGHYTSRIATEQPVMYVLLPEGNSQGHVALVLPTESRLRQRSIQVFDWTAQDLQARLNRLSWESLAEKVTERITGFVPQVDWIFFKPAATAKELAQLLAAVARRIEQAMPDVYEAEGEDGYLHNLLKSFQKELIANLKLKADNDKDYSFADIYAQTIAYGLFTARVFSFVKNPKADFSRDGAWSQLPETNPFLRQLFKDISEQSADDLGDELVDAISEAIAILRAAEMKAILEDFRINMNREDIVIRFYEDFLAAYKPTMRERRGVYYTPEPVVSYMVRSVDELIKDKFDKPLGIADPEVMILDPACGTGTFLLWIFKLIHERHQANSEAFEYSDWNDYVDHCLLPRIFGFELLMAPYAICHLKLGLFLEESGYRFETGKRLGVYLINTLEDIKLREESQQLSLNIPEMEELIAEEARAGSKVKKQEPIMVVIGNPPYSGHSENNNEWIKGLVNDYYFVDGKPLGERNPKWLQDDYVKFIRFAQWRIDKSGKGILAFITNHGFLDNPTFRGMRQSLINSFDSISILDLHGNSKKKEVCPDGSPDENVFDIQQGVSVTLAIKGVKSQINHLHLYGQRIDKYRLLSKDKFCEKDFNRVISQSPFYLLIPQDTDLFAEYEQYVKITDAMPVNVLGFQTHRDHFAIDFDKEKLYKRISELRNESISDEEYYQKYQVKDNRDWKLEKSRQNIKLDDKWGEKIISCLYRPFDWRTCYFSTIAMDYPRRELINHVAGKDNLCLLSSRQQSTLGYRHCWIANIPANDCVISTASREANQVFPLYLYPDSNKPKELQQKKHSSFSQNFVRKIQLKLGYLTTPETIFYYIYGIFHSPTYRTRYVEFLKIDFPRVPLTSNDRLFRQLADYGEQLVGLHLMTSPILDNLITEFTETGGDRTVAPGHPKYSDGKVNINKQGDGFVGVPEEVWNFYVGGYQVCQKWLKDRKGRVLSDEDILHYQKIVVALQETIKLMQLIDEAIPSWPIE
ncbi:type ISP restriction/modification enzyme [Synechocystis sp. LEGE 06083]|uniref:type ISP restriction/modification enzyme n=1 Tax=Synechocystis sp. LEGE 06083 TaxID=915336 RepID=UPI001D15417A|nr:type ISP restriction/modification enzyme [Synechocystis sp. LEGE 06083]